VPVLLMFKYLNSVGSGTLRKSFIDSSVCSDEASNECLSNLGSGDNGSASSYFIFCMMSLPFESKSLIGSW